MAGLVEQAQGMPQNAPGTAPGGPPVNAAPQGAPTPQGGTPQEANAMAPGQPTSKYEQEMGERVIAHSVDWIYGDGYDFIVKELSNGEPAQAAGKVCAKTILEQQKFAEVAGKEVPQSILFSVGQQVVEELFEVMDKEGIYKEPTPEEGDIKQSEALMYATEYYMANNPGAVSIETRDQLGADIENGVYDNMMQG